MPFSIPAWAKAKPLKSKTIATEFKVGNKNFGAGDLAYVVGIVNKMRGEKKNEPFVHTGNVASKGYGEVATMKDWRPWATARKRSPADELTVEVKGYFVQATTLPESSGSPVFIRRSIEKEPTGGVRTWVYGSVWLLGLWSGNWETRHEGNVIVGDDMGLCIPAPRILEVLEREGLKEMRRASKGALAPQSVLEDRHLLGK
jgi:hypothetical protein